MPAGQPCGQRSMLHPPCCHWVLTSDFSTSSAGPSGSHRVSPSPPSSQTLLNSTTLPPLPVHSTLYQQVPPLTRWLHLEIFKVGLIKLLEGDPRAQSEIRLFLKRGGRTALWRYPEGWTWGNTEQSTHEKQFCYDFKGRSNCKHLEDSNFICIFWVVYWQHCKYAFLSEPQGWTGSIY